MQFVWFFNRLSNVALQTSRQIIYYVDFIFFGGIFQYLLLCSSLGWFLYAILGAPFNIHPGISLLFLMLDLLFVMSLPLGGFAFYPSGHPEKNEYWKCPYSPLILGWWFDRPRFLHGRFLSFMMLKASIHCF